MYQLHICSMLHSREIEKLALIPSTFQIIMTRDYVEDHEDRWAVTNNDVLLDNELDMLSYDFEDRDLMMLEFTFVCTAL